MDVDDDFRLLDLPIEVFARVVQLSSTGSVLRLSAIGCASITKALSHPWVVLGLTLTSKKSKVSREDSAIGVLKRFPTLQDLSLTAPNSDSVTTGFDRLLLNLPPTLEALHLAFPGAKRIVASVAHCLSDLMPSLTTLSLNGSEETLDSNFWDHSSFPKTLSTLVLPDNDFTFTGALLTLPSHVTSLKLVKPPLIDSGDARQWPSSLKSLAFTGLVHLAGETFSWLPPNLEYLEVLYMGNIDENQLLNLPTTLTTLRLPYVSIPNVSPLGRLTRLKSLYCNSLGPNALMEQLPRSLTRIVLSCAPLFTDSVWIGLPPQLRRYVLSYPRVSKYRVPDPYAATAWDSTLIRVIPKTLEAFDATQFKDASEADLMHLPTSLTELKLITSSSTLLHTLSRTLTKMDVQCLKMNVETISALPRSLTDLTVQEFDSIDPSAMLQMPFGLQVLKIGSGCKMGLSNEIAQFLPSHLISLTISGNYDFDDSFFADLKLKYLQLLCIDGNKACRFTEAISPHLPRSLLRLELEGMKPWSTSHDAFAALPRRIEAVVIKWKPKPTSSSFMEPEMLKSLLPHSLAFQNFPIIPKNSVLSFFGSTSKPTTKSPTD